MSFKFPKVEDVAYELRVISSGLGRESTVRFQIFDSGDWWIHLGGAEGDIRQSGYWSESKVPGCGGPKHKPRKFNSKELAQKLIEEAQRKYNGSNQ